MKKFFLYSFGIIAMLMTSCKDGEFGGDFKVEGVKLQDFCGTWCVSVEANDFWFTRNYYAGSYDEDFLYDYFGGIDDNFVHGYFNPDQNGDGIVDLKDIEIYENKHQASGEVWADEYGLGIVSVITSNTADDNETEMWLSDNDFWGSISKITIDKTTGEFQSKDLTEIASTYSFVSGPEAKTSALSKTLDAGENDVMGGTNTVVIGGKILKNAATAPGSGNVCDSIIFYVKFNDDIAPEMWYKVSGYRKTGYNEDN